MLAGLGHGAVSTGNHDDSAVHLSSTGYHVLNVVGVSGAVNVSVVTVGSLILYVRSVDGDTALLLLGSVVDLVERLHLRKTVLGQYSGDSGGQRGLTVVHVADRADVYMRLRSFEFFFSHNSALFSLLVCYLF